MENQEEDGFWVWRPKFEGVIYLIAEVCGYNLVHEEFEVLLQELRGTNSDLDKWMEYEFTGSKGTVSLKMGYDEDYPYEMIHLALRYPDELNDLMSFVGMVDSMFLSWELENHAKN